MIVVTNLIHERIYIYIYIYIYILYIYIYIDVIAEGSLHCVNKLV